MFKQAATCDDSTDLECGTHHHCASNQYSCPSTAYSNPGHILHCHTQRRPHHKDVVLLTPDCTPSHTFKLFIRLHNCGGSHHPIISNESRYRASASGQVPGCITQDLCLSANISPLARKPHRHPPPPRPHPRRTIKSILASCITCGTAPTPHSVIGPFSISWKQQKRSLVQHLQGSCIAGDPTHQSRRSLNLLPSEGENAGSPGQEQQTERQLHQLGCHGAQLPPRTALLFPFCPVH